MYQIGTKLLKLDNHEIQITGEGWLKPHKMYTEDYSLLKGIYWLSITPCQYIRLAIHENVREIFSTYLQMKHVTSSRNTNNKYLLKPADTILISYLRPVLWREYCSNNGNKNVSFQLLLYNYVQRSDINIVPTRLETSWNVTFNVHFNPPIVSWTYNFPMLLIAHF
jgi:hypothetical protein